MKKAIRNNEGRDITDLQIPIGSADIRGTRRDKLMIRIIDEDGKAYCFKTNGNEIVSFKVGGMPEKVYERG